MAAKADGDQPIHSQHSGVGSAHDVTDAPTPGSGASVPSGVDEAGAGHAADGALARLRAEVQALQAALTQTTLQRDQLAASLSLAHTVIERMADAAYWAQSDGRLIYVNEAACQELGYTREELLAPTVIDVIPNFTALQWAAHWDDLCQAGTRRFEGWHRCKDDL